MILYIVAVLLINLITFGGGAVYIPMYRDVFVDIFNIFGSEQYYSFVSIVNLFPGITGGKLATYFLYLENGYIGMVIGLIVFIIPAIFFVLLIYRYFDKFKNSIIYKDIILYILPITIGVIISLGIELLKIGTHIENIFMYFIYVLIGIYGIMYKKIPSIYILIVALIISIIYNYSLI